MISKVKQLHIILCVFQWLVLLAIGDVVVDKTQNVSAIFDDGKWKVVVSSLDWNEGTGNVIARSNFENAQSETGWMFLEVETNESVDDQLQAQAAGILEGYLTRTSIIENYKEFYAEDICTTEPDLCVAAKNRYSENRDWIKTQVKENADNDPYWHQIDLFYLQMEGIIQGIKINEVENGLEEDPKFDYDLGVIMLNFLPDFWDIKEQFDLVNSATTRSADPKLGRSSPSCSVLIKYLPNENEVVFGHNAWFEYRAMSYRLLKVYALNYHLTKNSKEPIPGRMISMSSYAGVAMSLDDFYISSSGIGAMETSLYVYNKELFRNANSEDIVYEGARVMTSLRLAENGQQWSEIFSKFNSGTYNNQWMIMDFNLLKKSSPGLPDGFFTVIEQLPNKIVVEDQTKVLRNITYWASYNRAFYPEIFDLSGAQKLIDEFGDWFTYDKTPRAKIFQRDHTKVNDVDSLMQLLRYNDFENDPFALVDGCTPGRTQAGSIASRLDLGSSNFSCSFGAHDYMVGFSPYGALDAKVASSASFPSLAFNAVAGPTHGDLHQPFDWTTTGVTPVPKFRPIDKFDFSPIKHYWSIKSLSVESNRQNKQLKTPGSSETNNNDKSSANKFWCHSTYWWTFILIILEMLRLI